MVMVVYGMLRERGTCLLYSRFNLGEKNLREHDSSSLEEMQAKQQLKGNAFAK